MPVLYNLPIVDGHLWCGGGGGGGGGYRWMGVGRARTPVLVSDTCTVYAASRVFPSLASSGVSFGLTLRCCPIGCPPRCPLRSPLGCPAKFPYSGSSGVSSPDSLSVSSEASFCGSSGLSFEFPLPGAFPGVLQGIFLGSLAEAFWGLGCSLLCSPGFPLRSPMWDVLL